MLDLRRIRITLRCPLDHEPCGREIPFDLVGAKEYEIYRDLMTPPLVKMDDFCADVKCQEKHTPRSQDPAKFAKRGDHAIPRHMDERIERNDPLPSFVGYGKRHHVRPLELYGGIQPLGALNHSWREVDSNDTDAAVMEVARDVARATPDIGDQPEVANLPRKLVQKLAIERLVLKLRRDARGVLVGDGVIAGPRIVAALVAHSPVQAVNL